LEEALIPSRRALKKARHKSRKLIGAAEAGCFSMALSANLKKAGHLAKRVSTVATVKLEMVEGAPKITMIDLKTEANVPGIDAAKFHEIAEQTKKGRCPQRRSARSTIKFMTWRKPRATDAAKEFSSENR